MKLFNVPPVYWFKGGFDYVASALDRPLYINPHTASATRVGLARAKY